MEEQLKEEIPLCTLVHPRAKYSFFAAAALKPIPCGLIAALSLLLVPWWIATLVILQNTHVALQAFKMTGSLLSRYQYYCQIFRYMLKA